MPGGGYTSGLVASTRTASATAARRATRTAVSIGRSASRRAVAAEADSAPPGSSTDAADEDRLHLVGVLQHPQRLRRASRQATASAGGRAGDAAISSRTPGPVSGHAELGQHRRRLAHLVAQVPLGVRSARRTPVPGPGSGTR